MVALVCLWAVAHLLFFGNVSHARDQDLLFHEYRSELAALTAPTGPGAEAGDPVALMTIPAIGLDEVVVEGTAAGDLMAGPGHLRTTVIPGQAGQSVVFGRSTTYGAPFRRIDELEPGDEIKIVDGQGEITLSVIGVRHDGDPFAPPLEEGAARLTLVTSEGHGPLAALSPGKTVFVDADAGEGFPSPGVVNPEALPPSEAAMARGTEALPTFCLCLLLLTTLVVAIVAARQRWSLPLVWVVAAPVAVALAWATTDAAMRLLPNLI
jgi:sortase A